MTASTEPNDALQGARVLVADDESELANVFAEVLRRRGCVVETVTDGTSALMAIQERDHDVIVSDIHMPGLSGLDLLRSIRDRDLDVPVLLVTGDPRLETAVQAIEHGALQYLAKPVTAGALCAAVSRAVRLHGIARLKREAITLLGPHQLAVADRAGLVTRFDRGLAELFVVFQPIVSVGSRSTFGYEALLRSREPSLANPQAFLTAAERLDRLPELSRRIRDVAAQLFEGAPAGATLFVNLHAQDLLDPSLSDRSAPLTQHADRVVLEITERAALADIDDVVHRVADLRGLGYRIAIDDLGAGYAGLTSFALLEPEFVKLDRSLVADVHSSPIKRALVGSMTQLCRDLGLRVIAEGIEQAAGVTVLSELGCDLMQGFLFARPAPAFAVPAWP